MDNGGTTIVAFGHISTPPRRKGEPRGEWQMRRAITLGDEVRSLIVGYRPGAVFYEYPEHPRGGSQRGREFAVMGALGFAEGVLMGACRPSVGEVTTGAPVSVPPEVVKRYLTGSPSAPKDRVHMAVWAAHPTKAIMDATADEIDAIALGMYGAAQLKDPVRGGR